MPTGGDIPSLPVTALPIYVKLAWGYESDVFDFFSDKLLNFSLNSLIKIDVHGRFAKCNLEASRASWGTWERPPSGPAPVGVGTASKMPLRVGLTAGGHVVLPQRSLCAGSWSFWQPDLATV